MIRCGWFIAVIQFIEATGDRSVLEESVAFLEGDELAEGQKEAYFQPRISETRGSLFEHCARALDRSLELGAHGLPLMGTGDWNDGMNRVGQDGKGESVWLGWFLHTVLGSSRSLRTPAASTSAPKSGGFTSADSRPRWSARVGMASGIAVLTLTMALRLGSAENAECRIDAIAQSWSIMSGAAERGRSQRAMAAVDQQLIRRPEGLILLLAPPFNHPVHDPGYIKGYPPGIRENGGQYYARLHLESDCICRTRRRRQSGRTLPHDESDQSLEFTSERAAL